MILPAILLATAQASAPATAPPPPVVEFVTPPQPRGSTQSLFSPDDYPADAPKAGPHGRVAMMLQVDAQGRVIGCSVFQSSGSPILDDATCRIVQRRARFIPARDSSGPVASLVAQSVDWDHVFKEVQVIRGN